MIAIDGLRCADLSRARVTSQRQVRRDRATRILALL